MVIVTNYRLGKTESSYERVCSDADVVREVLNRLTEFGLQGGEFTYEDYYYYYTGNRVFIFFLSFDTGLQKFELPTALTLCEEQVGFLSCCCIVVVAAAAAAASLLLLLLLHCYFCF